MNGLIVWKLFVYESFIQKQKFRVRGEEKRAYEVFVRQSRCIIHCFLIIDRRFFFFLIVSSKCCRPFPLHPIASLVSFSFYVNAESSIIVIVVLPSAALALYVYVVNVISSLAHKLFLRLSYQ